MILVWSRSPKPPKSNRKWTVRSGTSRTCFGIGFVFLSRRSRRRSRIFLIFTCHKRAYVKLVRHAFCRIGFVFSNMLIYYKHALSGVEGSLNHRFHRLTQISHKDINIAYINILILGHWKFLVQDLIFNGMPSCLLYPIFYFYQFYQKSAILKENSGKISFTHHFTQ